MLSRSGQVVGIGGKRVVGEGGVMRGGDPAGLEVDGGDASGECNV